MAEHQQAALVNRPVLHQDARIGSSSPRCVDPLTLDTAEFFESYPQEAAIVLQRGVEFSALLSVALVVHCAVLAGKELVSASVDPDGFDVDFILQGLCLARVACVAPRPYWWIVRRARFVEARTLPTPQQISRRLLEIQSTPSSVVEDLLQSIFYGWLICTTAVVCLARLVPEPTPLTEQVWQHLILNLVSMAIHRVSCLYLFYKLTNSELKRGVSDCALDAESTKLQYAPDAHCTEQLGDFGQDDCSICLCSYSEGQEIRKLACGHCFHRCCLDPWLLNHRNRCPLCMELVGEPH